MGDTERLRAALLKIREHAAQSSRQDASATLHMIMASVDAALEERSPAPDTRPGLTGRQAEFLAFIEKYQAAHGYSPNVREIGKAMGIKSPNGVMAHIRCLQKKGRIRYTAETARSIVLIGGGA